jgi:hypothetical protein
MLDKDTLKILIERYEKLIKAATEFGFVDLRLFCTYSPEDKDTLNFMEQQTTCSTNFYRRHVPRKSKA